MSKAKSTDKFDLHLLAERLEEIKKVDEDGNVRFVFPFPDIISVLQSSQNFEGIPEVERMRITLEAVRKAASRGKITRNTLLEEINRAKTNFLKTPPKPFILAMSLSVDYSERIKKTVIDGNTVTIAKNLPRHFDQNIIQKLIQSCVPEAQPKNFSATKVRVLARNTNEAFESGLETIDYIRGIWNFIINRKTIARISTGRLKPINLIRLGPVCTLHHANGKLACKTFWYEQQFYNKDSKSINQNDWARIRKEENSIRNRIKKIPYGNELKTIFVRYSHSLDSTDYESCYLKLWSLLETLTDTVGGSYDKTIKRTTFIYKDKEFHRQILEHLRSYRNLSVHADQSSEQIETFVFQLKRYVEDLMNFHLYSRANFKSIYESGNFMDLPGDISDLKNKISLYKKALKFKGDE